jgi:hypothetical protein
LILPVVGICILIAIKHASTKNDDVEADIIPSSFPSESLTPLSFQDYLTAAQAKRVCIDQGNGNFTITGMNAHSYNWQVPMVKCNTRLCTNHGQDAAHTACEYNIIGIAGTTDRVDDFLSYLQASYPVLSKQKEVFPFEYDLFRQFKDSNEMDQYVTAEDYGIYPENPKLAMGIVFHGNDPNVYHYSLRQNATNYNAVEEDARPATFTTPDTSIITKSNGKNDESVCVPIEGAPLLGPLQSSCTGQYMYNGVLTFQRLVQDFIIDNTGASSKNFVSQSGVQFVSFPYRSYKDDGFYETIDGKSKEYYNCNLQHEYLFFLTIYFFLSGVVNRFWSFVDNLGTINASRVDGKLHCSRKGTSTERVDEDDERYRK